MKVQNGRAKLERGEIRVNNFFFKREAGHIKIADLNEIFTHRVSVRVPVGIWLNNIYEKARKGEETAKKTLGVYASVLWAASSVAPDDEWCDAMMIVTEDAMKRHPEWYGGKAKATPEEDAKALDEVKEMAEFEQEVKDLADKAE